MLLKELIDSSCSERVSHFGPIVALSPTFVNGDVSAALSIIIVALILEGGLLMFSQSVLR